MTVIALLFVFVVPIGLLFFTEGEAIYDDGLTGLCCLSLLSGIALILVIASKDASWKKSLDEAKIEVLKEANANVPEKAMKGWYLGAGALFFVGMFFEAVFMTFSPSSSSSLVLWERVATVRKSTNISQEYSRECKSHEPRLLA
ncbi:MAG: hypothetical protein CM15mP78_03730 [Candidatus Poseidoniales archaeon]|nr:MAG: hypothetical protein CM15mP78_03730 [Candidatus Poseidoniales archaeon]